MRRADLVLAVAAALWLAPRESSALDRVVVLTPSETPVSARLRAELGALGVDTLTMAPPEDVSPAALEGIAFDKEALATIVLVGREQVVEIWIADRTTGKTVIRRVPVASDGIPDDVAVTKTVELFRASLLEVHLDAEAERKAPAAVQKIVGPTPLPARSEPTVTTRLGGAVAVGAGGVPPTGHVDLAVVGRVSDLVSVGGSVLVPTLPATFTIPEGELTYTQVWAEALIELHPQRGPIADPRFGLGLGAHVAHLSADAEGDRRGYAPTTAAFLATVTAGVSFPLSSMIGLDTQAKCGLALPRTDYLIEETSALTTGWPLCSFTGGVSLSL